MTEMIEKLGKMTSLGVFEDPANIKIVTDMLENGKHLSKARIHPIKVNCYSYMLLLKLVYYYSRKSFQNCSYWFILFLSLIHI